MGCVHRCASFQPNHGDPGQRCAAAIMMRWTSNTTATWSVSSYTNDCGSNGANSRWPTIQAGSGGFGRRPFGHVASSIRSTSLIPRQLVPFPPQARKIPRQRGSGKGVWLADTLVGTDSHTTMVNGLGVLGWGVGGIEAEAVMLGQPIYMLAPDVVGVRLTGGLQPR